MTIRRLGSGVSQRVACSQRERRRRRRVTSLALLVAVFSGWSCGSAEESDSLTASHSERIVESSAAQTRVDELHSRFVAAATKLPMLGAGVASGFELFDDSVRVAIPLEAKRGVIRTASVALPLRASDPVRLEDDSSHLAVSFALRGANDATVAVTGGIALYPGALGGADVLHRVHAEGTEDYVVFEQRPANEEIAYDVDVSRVAGLRLVSNTLEFLDEEGAPRLRVAPPFVVDTTNRQKEAVLTVGGCAFDTSPKAPWGRAVTSPGASHCSVRVVWKAVAYPAMVDPSWTVTSSMVMPRNFHGATLLASGQVLIAGGYIDQDFATTTSAELYDSASGSFAATGSMAVARCVPTLTPLGSGQVLIAGGWLGPGFAATSDAERYDPATGLFTLTSHPMATPRRLHTATLLASGEVLIAGGLTSADAASAVSSAELYDPTTDDFVATTGSMTTLRGNHGALLLGSGKVLVAGGVDDSTVLASAELYDPETDTFTATGPMANARMATTVAVLLHSGKALITGGYDGTIDSNSGTATSSAELYDEDTGTFTTTGSMKKPRYCHSVTLLDSGDVLIAGGWASSSSMATSSAELYEVDTGTFVTAGPMMAARGSHTATLLPSGEVLIAGGWNFGQIRGAELFSTESADGGGGASTDAADDASDGGASTAKPAESSGGGGCRIAEPRRSPTLPLFWLAVGGMLFMRRLRRRSRASKSAALLALLVACTSCGSPEEKASAPSTDAVEAIHFVGRFDTSGQGALFGYPASTIMAHFTGTGIDLKLADGTDWFDVSIDGAAPTALEMTGAPVYHLASDLAPGEHVVTITKRTEAAVGTARFESLAPIGGELVPTLLPHKRQIEIIGDSLSTGYGVLGTDPCIGEASLEDEDLAWSALAATELGAMRTVIAYGGNGISRTSAGETDALLPEIWKRTIADDPSSTWDFSRYTPDVVIVFAGTNDFALGDPGQAFADAYDAFLAALRAQYPKAYIVCITISYPKQLVQYVRVCVNKVNLAGDAKVSYLGIDPITETDFVACGQHPSAAGHVKMADKIVAHIRGVTGW